MKDFDITKSSFIDTIDAFMLGIDSSLDREILRYVYRQHGNVANFNMIQHNVVCVNNYCSTRRLFVRLDNLCKFGFLKKSEFRGTIFYEINKDSEEKSKIKNL